MALSDSNKTSRLFKALMGASETKTIRDFFEEPVRSAPAVLPSQIWQYGNWVPTGAASDPAGVSAILAIQALQTDQATYSVTIDESTVVPLVKRWIKRPLTMIDAGTNNAFKLIDNSSNPIQNIIPFNFGDGTSYNYNLYKSDGSTPIAFGIGDWVFDPNSGVLTFYNVQNVTGVSAILPPVISFYQYIGGNGVPSSVAGYDGAILPITRYNGGAGVSAWGDGVLDSDIILATEAVQTDFLTLHGWDGSDTSEGVAVSFQKLIPLIYHTTKDPVATGSGLNAVEVMTLMAHRGISVNLQSISGFIVDFVSEGTPVGSSLVQITYNPTTGSLALSDDGANFGPAVTGINTLISGQAVKIKTNSNFVILRRTGASLPGSTVTDTLTIVDTTTRVALMAWDADAEDFLPYVNTDATSQFDFGFPIVMKLGRIPPSFKLGQTSSGGFSDVITPQYYGARPTSVIVAVEDSATPANSTANSSGADYTVTNTTGGYLQDIISQVYNNNSNFAGEILLRQGHYKLSSDMTLNGSAGLKIKGEAPEAVIIDANGASRNIVIQSSGVSENDVFLYDLTFLNTFNINVLASGAVPSMLFMRGVVGPSVNISIPALCGATISECGSLGALTIAGTAALTRSFESSVFSTVNLNGTGASFHGCIINILVGHATTGTANSIAACQIGTLTSLNESNQYIGNAVTSYGVAVTAKFKMLPQKFEIIDADGYRRWTGFTGPIVWNNTTKLIELSYDTSVFSLDGNGKLIVSITASLVSFNPTGVTRADGTNVVAATVQNALVDLYSHKADLDAYGKVNLSQLPDAITGSGMAYKGMWEFDAHSGAYPTATDIAGNVGEIGSGTALQPGWFLVVSANSSPTMPVGPQTAVLQTGESTPLIFTAGDWAIYNGTVWERVDNSFADPSYTILPTTPPDGAWTDGLLALGGTTIVEATDQINEILAKLAPPKPINLSAMALAFKTASPYTAAESGTGTVRASSVVNSTQPAITTPTGADTINTLFYDGESGTLTATIDSVASGSRVLSTGSDVGVYTSLNIVADNDPWFGTAGKANFWKGLRAEIDPASALALGVHVVSMTHSSSGSTPSFTFYVDNPAVTMSVTGATITTLPPMSKYLSGVPSIQPSSSFVISAFTAVGVVGQYYNSTNVATITCNVSGVSSASCAVTSVPATPTAGTYANASAGSKTLVMPASAYSENVSFTLIPYNSRGITGTTASLSSGYRIDTTTETERVCSGDGTDPYPAISSTSGLCGATFDSTISLIGANASELQKINSHYIWPINTSYASYVGSGGAGPNYTGAAGVTVTGHVGTWRWATYKFASEFSNNSAFTLAFTSPSGFSADSNQITANMLIYAKVVGASGTGWLDANAAYPGAGTPVLDGDPAMVAGNSDASNKRITFGPVVRTGDLYIRVAVKSSSGIQFNGVTIGSLA